MYCYYIVLYLSLFFAIWCSCALWLREWAKQIVSNLLLKFTSLSSVRLRFSAIQRMLIFHTLRKANLKISESKLSIYRNYQYWKLVSIPIILNSQCRKYHASMAHHALFHSLRSLVRTVWFSERYVNCYSQLLQVLHDIGRKLSRQQVSGGYIS